MLDAIRAEALKLRRHRATWLMVWIYPIVFGLLVAVQLIRDLAHIPSAPPPATAALWIEQNALIWQMPLSGIGRFIIAGFAGLAFAGEYAWNTWKLIIPTRQRWQLVAAKWLVVSLFVFLAFATADLLGLFASLSRPLVGGPGIPPYVTFTALAEGHAIAAARSILPICYTVLLASLFAILTTSVLASVILSMAVITLEQLLMPIAMLAYGYAPSLTVALVQALPFYHMANILAWTKGSGLVLPLGPGTNLAASWSTSALMIAAWLAAFCAATLARFARQDLN